jgi:raw score 4.34
MKKLLTISLALLSFVSISCEASNHKNQSGVKSSISTEKTRAINLNLMLKEVFETRITDIASQRADVSHIVSKYLHSGMDKKEISDLISDQFEILEKENKLFAHYKKGEGYLGNRRDFYIELLFSKDGKLLKNKSYLDKSNNL